MKIKKAVIPVAGKGTRFLPATKQTPKEIIPILNVPMIHYVVKEAVDSGIEQIIFVTSSGKESIENYFDRNLELETFLAANGKHDYQKMVEEIGSLVDVATIRQKEQLGLGHAIACASPLVGNDDFAVLLGDDLVINDFPVTKQLIDVYEKQQASVIGVMEVPNEETNKYGIVDGSFIENNKKSLVMNKMVEKPDPKDAPTNLATPGRYILKNEIFSCLKEIPRGAGGEYQLTDAINLLAQQEKVCAHIFEGERFDTGSIKGYLNATIEFALRDPDLKSFALDTIKEKLERYS